MKASKYKPATEKELAAIEAVKAAIRGLPRSIYVSVDDFDGVLEFWKPHSSCAAHEAAPPLRRTQAFKNNHR